MDLENRVFFLTGCASGIGRHLAGVFLRGGARVFATDHAWEALEARAAGDRWPVERLRLRALDVRDRAAWEAAVGEAVDAWGRIDVGMNIAGVTYAKPVHESAEDRIDQLVDVNLKGTIHGTQCFARHMIARGGGHIVNIASMAALSPVKGLCLYSASKFGVRGFSLSAAMDLKPLGVDLTVICPDAVDTPMLEAEARMPDAALVFTSKRPLTVFDLERAMLRRVLPQRPLEVSLPRRMGALTRLAGTFPGLLGTLGPLFWKAGARHQAEYLRAGHGGPDEPERGDSATR